MTKPIKIILLIVSALIVLLITGYFVANAIASSKLEGFLENELPENLSVEYDVLEVSLWRGKVLLAQPKIVNRSNHSSAPNLEVELDTFLVEGFGLWTYFFNDDVQIKSVKLRSPKVVYRHNSAIPKEEEKKSFLEHLNQAINVERFNIHNAEVYIKDVESDSLLLHTQQLTANVLDISVDTSSVKNRIPFNYGDYDLSFNNLFHSMGVYENLTISSAQITNDNVALNQLKLFTKYSKAKFDQMISVERDHFDVSITSLVVEGQKFGFEKDSVFYFNSPKITFVDPEMYIYRNKLIADDQTRKKLYSRMLRELSFDLTLNEIQLKNGTIVYSEKVNSNMGAGNLSFSKLNAHIKNISNTYGPSEKTTLDIDAVFMARTPLKVQWDFDVNNVNDAFVFKADIGKLPAADMNPFSQPNLKVELEGELLKTYATISGDANTSQIAMRANYEDFKVKVLDSEGEKKNTILSAIANLFIKNSSNKASDGFREGSKEGIERDHTKSIFNFIWISIKAGLVKVLTGDGKK